MSQNNYLIYKHTSPSGKSYIGQTKNLSKRNYTHKVSSGCSAFSSAIKKYGWDAFTHEILKTGLTLSEANLWEEFYIKNLNSLFQNGYNLTTGGDSREVTNETKKKIGVGNKGKVRSEDVRKRIGIGNTGKFVSKETGLKISASLKGRPMSEKVRKIFEEANKNRVFSEDTRKKLSEAGKKECSPKKQKEKFQSR